MQKTLIVALTVALLSGCGNPQYAVKPSEAKNSIAFEKSAMGDVQVAATVGADTTATIDDLQFKTANGSTGKVKKVQFQATPSASLTAQVAAMEAYRGQQNEYFTGLANVATANWSGFASAIQAAAPIAGPFLQGLAQAKLARAQRPGLIEQLSGLVMAGQTSTAAMKEIDVPADILSEVDARVDARIAELAAAQAKAQVAAEKATAAEAAAQKKTDAEANKSDSGGADPPATAGGGQHEEP
jgi:hypothetical protein